MKLNGKYFGFYRAKVIENNIDDNKYGAVKVFVPDLMVGEVDENGKTDESKGINAYPANNPVGGYNNEDDEGTASYQTSVYIPAKNSWCWIFFEGGDLSRPFYFAAFNYKNSMLPPENRNVTDPAKVFTVLKTNTGRSLIVSDSTDCERIEICGKKRQIDNGPEGDNASSYNIDDNMSTILFDERDNKEKILVRTRLGDFINIDIDDRRLQINFANDIIINTDNNLYLNVGGDMHLKVKNNLYEYIEGSEFKMVEKNKVDNVKGSAEFNTNGYISFDSSDFVSVHAVESILLDVWDSSQSIYNPDQTSISNPLLYDATNANEILDTTSDPSKDVSMSYISIKDNMVKTYTSTPDNDGALSQFDGTAGITMKTTKSIKLLGTTSIVSTAMAYYVYSPDQHFLMDGYPWEGEHYKLDWYAAWLSQPELLYPIGDRAS